MEINKNNEEVRIKNAILKQKLTVLQINKANARRAGSTASYDVLIEKVEKEIAELDERLCRTEIITKFDLMEFD